MNKRFRFRDFSRNQKLTFTSTAVGTALSSMDLLFLSFAMTFIIAEFHINNAAGGLMLTISDSAKFIGGIIFGLLADTYSRVKVFTYTLALIALATVAMFFAKDMTVIYICRFLVGLGAGGEGGVGDHLACRKL